MKDEIIITHIHGKGCDVQMNVDSHVDATSMLACAVTCLYEKMAAENPTQKRAVRQAITATIQKSLYMEFNERGERIK